MKRKDRVRRHRLFGGDIPNAEAFEVDRSPMLLNQHDGAGKLSSCDFIFEESGQPLQSSGSRRRGAGIGLRARVYSASGHDQGYCGQRSYDCRYHWNDSAIRVSKGAAGSMRAAWNLADLSLGVHLPFVKSRGPPPLGARAI